MRLATLDDMALLERYRDSGDELAFAQIVRRYRALVYAACVRVLCDRAAAEDAAQETFFKLMQRPDAVRRSLAGWLHRAATQLSIDILRSESARRRRESAYNQQRAQEPTRWRDLAPIIDTCLDELPAGSRTLLIEHFLQGVSQKDIAEGQAVSEATISRRMHKALEKLRRKLHARGVAFSVAAVTGLLLANAAQAAPPNLCRELGRMALASGAARAGGTLLPPATSGASSIGVVRAAMIIAALVTLLVLATFLITRIHQAANAPKVGLAEPVARHVIHDAWL